MPNKKGGKKFKKGKKQGFTEKQIIYKDPKEDQEYGRIINACGNGRFQVYCFDGKERMGVIAGNMRKRVWVNKDDIVLISRWEFTTDGEKCSIIHKYDEDEARKLQSQGEFPVSIQLDTSGEYEKDTSYHDDDLFGYHEEQPKTLPLSDESDTEEEIDMDEI